MSETDDNEGKGAAPAAASGTHPASDHEQVTIVCMLALAIEDGVGPDWPPERFTSDDYFAAASYALESFRSVLSIAAVAVSIRPEQVAQRMAEGVEVTARAPNNVNACRQMLMEAIEMVAERRGKKIIRVPGRVA